MGPLRRVCVFCGSNRGVRPAYVEAAATVGALLASRDIGVVYGGGNVGLMGAVADAALAAGGEVIGVIPEALRAMEVAHEGLTRLHVVGSMHERKALMADLSDGFLALPGGYGTFEELCEVITWTQLGIHRKPVALLNVAGYFDHLLALIRHAVAERFIGNVHRGLLLHGTDPAALLGGMERYQPPRLHKWIDAEER